MLRLLKGEELDALSREPGVMAAALSEWREKVLAGAKANLKSREPAPANEHWLLERHHFLSPSQAWRELMQRQGA